MAIEYFLRTTENQEQRTPCFENNYIITYNHNFHFSFEEAQTHMETIKHLRHLSAFKFQKQESLSNRK